MKISKGDIFETNSGDVIVTNYERNTAITIKFLDVYGFEATVTTNRLIRGNIKNPYYPSVFGIGCMGWYD